VREREIKRKGGRERKRERMRVRKREREREKEGEKERERVTGALAPFSYLVYYIILNVIVKVKQNNLNIM